MAAKPIAPEASWAKPMATLMNKAYKTKQVSQFLDDFNTRKILILLDREC